MLDEKMLDNNILNNNTNNYGTNDNNTNKIYAYKKLYNKINENYCAIGNKIFGRILFAEINKMLPSIAGFILIESIVTTSTFVANITYMTVNDQTKENNVIIEILEHFFLPIIKGLLKSTNILTAEAIGKKDYNQVREILKHSYLIGLLYLTIVIPGVLITSKYYLYGNKTVSRYTNIWVMSLPCVVIYEVLIQFLMGLEEMNIVLGFTLIKSILIASLTPILTPKFQEDGLPLSLLITNFIQAVLLPLYIYKKQAFNKYFTKDNSDNHQAGGACEHCRMNVKLLKQILAIGMPISFRAGINHLFSMFFILILNGLGPNSKLIASLIEKMSDILNLPLSATAKVLSPKMAVIYGQSKTPTLSIEEKTKLKNDLTLKSKAALIIQYFFYIPTFIFMMIETSMVSDFFEEITQMDLSPKNENDLHSIARIIFICNLITSCSYLLKSFCDSFQKTYIPFYIECLESALNFLVSICIFKLRKNHGELIDYDYSFLATTVFTLFTEFHYVKYRFSKSFFFNADSFSINPDINADSFSINNDLKSPLSHSSIASQDESLTEGVEDDSVCAAV
jgi:Na+-driven multidrug efflux pump